MQSAGKCWRMLALSLILSGVAVAPSAADNTDSALRAAMAAGQSARVIMQFAAAAERDAAFERQVEPLQLGETFCVLQSRAGDRGDEVGQPFLRGAEQSADVVVRHIQAGHDTAVHQNGRTEDRPFAAVAQFHGRSVIPFADHLLAAAVPFVFVSGYGDEDLLPEHLRDHPRFDKPVEAERLVGCLVELTRRP